MSSRASRRRNVASVLATAVLGTNLFCPGGLLAETIQWTGASGTDWWDAGNWSADRPPTADDILVINDPLLPRPQANAAINGGIIQFTNGAGGSFASLSELRLDISGGGTVTNGDFVGGLLGGTDAEINLSGAGTYLQNQAIYTGLKRTSNPSVAVLDGARLSSTGMSLEHSAVVDGPGSRWDNVGLAAAHGGAAWSPSLTVQNGGTWTTQGDVDFVMGTLNLHSGGTASASGTATIALLDLQGDSTFSADQLLFTHLEHPNAGMKWTSGTLNIGSDWSPERFAYGDLRLAAGMNASVGGTTAVTGGMKMIVDGGSLSAGHLQVSGAGAEFTDLSAGTSTNQLSVLDGAVASTRVGTANAVTVDKAQWINTGSFSMTGGQTLTIQNQAVVTHVLPAGESLSMDGAVTVDQSRWQIQRDLVVGDHGYGSLNVTAEGQVSADNVTFGRNAGSTAYGHTTGYLETRNLIVGDAGDALVVLGYENGPFCFTFSNSAIIGKQSSGYGRVLVNGQWLNTGRMDVGAEGRGRLTIQSGTVFTDDLVIGAQGAVVVGYTGMSSPDYASRLETASLSGPGALLWHSGTIALTGDYTLDNSSVFGSVLQLTAPKSLEVRQTLTLENGGGLHLDGGSLSVGEVNVLPDSAFTWDKGTLAFTGNLDLTADGLLGAHVGLASDRRLEVAGRTTISSGVAVDVGGTGFFTPLLTVSGAGASYVDHDGLSQVHSLRISEGGYASTGQTSLDAAAGLEPEALIADGPGSHWTNASALLELRGNVSIRNGALVETVVTDAVEVDYGYMANVEGSGTQWHIQGNMRVGSHFSGTLSVSDGAIVDVSGNLNLGAGGNAAMAIRSGGTVDVGGSLQIGGNSHVLLAGGTLSLNQLPDLTKVDWQSGKLVVKQGVVSIGAGSQLGSHLTLDGEQKSLEVAGTFRVNDGASLTFSNNGLRAGSLVLASGEIYGSGDTGGRVSGSFDSAITATGDLTMGDAARLDGFTHQGALEVGSHTVRLLSGGYAKLGHSTNLAGGGLIAPKGIALDAGDNLQGFGVVDGAVSAASGSVIDATGNLQLGKSTASDGFFSDGRLHIHQHTVTLRDRNTAVLGSWTTIGNEDTGVGGRLIAANGLLLEEGKSIEGFGAVQGALRNNGDVYGGTDGRILTFEGLVTGRGAFHDSVVFAGGFSPGLSPAVIPLEDAAFAPGNVLVMELGGLLPGTQHDKLVASGTLAFGGELQVALIDGFTPAYNDRFDLFDWSATTGSFSKVTLPSLGQGLSWDTSELYRSGDLMVVPEPGTICMLAVTTLGMLARRKEAKRR